ncbi:hypothetical protein N7519_008870 [Penicillium mononematosum]|uniref:uncharacterized protein n=1 Tax=Penicillium mononematosum TaxID=268346 RepID=UPI002549773F|nr:uncharacterized protein N7519_008870 [Penicillium mononematosum]KAJ6178409.1 hypothetical protein N7519_008870 [Penicillium mononematosum]
MDQNGKGGTRKLCHQGSKSEGREQGEALLVIFSETVQSRSLCRPLSTMNLDSAVWLATGMDVYNVGSSNELLIFAR